MTSCWIITEEGLIGTENQCLGVAEAMGLKPEVKRIQLTQPWKSLTPYISLESGKTFTGSLLEPPWPDLILASGRKSIAASRYIKRKSKNKTFTVQIQDPRVPPSQFDLVAVPQHDPTRGDNVIVTTATPNRITNEKLHNAKEQFSDIFAPLPAPRVAVLIGGHSKAYQMPPSIMKKLAGQLKTLTKQGYGLMITTSRRTGQDNERILHDALKGTNAYIWDGQGENPYFGLLGWADYIIVTSDSASMVSEAATTGTPVFMVSLEGGTKRFDKFHNALINKGTVKHFEGELASYEYEPLSDAAIVATAINQRMKDIK